MSSSCLSNKNSDSFDNLLYDPDTVSGTALYQAAYDVLQSECISCHSGAHSTWSGFSSEDWVGAYVNPGDPAGSPLVQSLRGWGTGGQDMPVGGTLSSTQYQAIEDWINSM